MVALRRDVRRWVRILATLGLVYLALPTRAHAEWHAGISVGLARAEDLNTTPALQIELRRAIFARWELQLDVGFWQVRQDLEQLLMTTTRDLNVGITVRYWVPVKFLRLFAGTGMGVHWIRTRAEFAGFGAQRSVYKLSIHTLGGLEAALSDHLVISGQIRYDFVTDYNQARALVGVLYRW